MAKDNLYRVVRTMKLLIIGDSLVTGYGVPSGKAWLDLVQQGCQLSILNKGINGDTTSDVLVRFSEDVLAHRPDTVFILAGTNDALRGRTANFIYNNVLEMIRLCNENGIQPILILQPNILIEPAERAHEDETGACTQASHTLKRYRRLIEDYCIDEHIDVIDFNKAFAEADLRVEPERYFYDGIHMTEAAHKKVADKFMYKFNVILLQRKQTGLIIKIDPLSSSK